MANNDEPTTAIPLSLEAVRPQLCEVKGVPHIIVPPEWQTISAEELLSQPQRTKEVIRMNDLKSFVDYLNRFKSSATIIALSSTADTISAIAVIDYHQPGPRGAQWCDHRVVFKARFTRAFHEWMGANETFMRQAAFADFIYRNQADIHSPKGADILETIKTLKATARGEFKDMKDLSTGSVEIMYRMQVSARGGTTDQPVSLPDELCIRLVPFFGADCVDYRADILVETPRSESSPLQLGYRLYRPDLIWEGLVARTSDRLTELTALPVYRCSEFKGE